MARPELRGVFEKEPDPVPYIDYPKWVTPDASWLVHDKHDPDKKSVPGYENHVNRDDGVLTIKVVDAAEEHKVTKAKV